MSQELKNRLLELTRSILKNDDIEISTDVAATKATMSFSIKPDLDPFGNSIVIDQFSGEQTPHQTNYNIQFYSHLDVHLLSFRIEEIHMRTANMRLVDTHMTNAQYHKVYVISQSEFEGIKRATVIRQAMLLSTTNDNRDFSRIVDKLEERFNESEVINTIDDLA